jgi:tight adherence protein C
LIGPFARDVGSRLARLVGVEEDVAVRLARVDAGIDVTDFRLRQVGHAVVAAALAAAGCALLSPIPAVMLAFLLGAPVLAFLVTEQRLAARSQEWQRRFFLELPVVAEQLAMLLDAGLSVPAALDRVAQRGSGVVALDLRRVSARLRQGVPERVALREWAERADVRALHQLVPVLAISHDTGGLGRLVAEEARSIRRDAHRELLEQVERRGQQVWVPVTVSALVPGVLFMAIPFVEALSLFGGR